VRHLLFLRPAHGANRGRSSGRAVGVNVRPVLHVVLVLVTHPSEEKQNKMRTSRAARAPPPILPRACAR
jgi:hypothetical protein